MCNRVAVQWGLLCKARPWIHQLQISNSIQVTVPLVIISDGAVYNVSYEVTETVLQIFFTFAWKYMILIGCTTPHSVGSFLADLHTVGTYSHCCVL
jgi:hypothetical protein